MSTLTGPTVTDLLADARGGDEQALDLLLRQHRDAIEAVCHRRLRSRVDAEDAVQETMLRAMRSLDALRDPSRLRSYLCRIAERVCLDMMRAGARPMPTPVTAGTVDLADGPEHAALRKEEAAMVRAALEALNQRQAQALWMRDALGEPVPVVAESLGVTEGSARVLLSRARKQMRDGWGKVAAMIPGFGLKMPGPLAKIFPAGGLAPVAIAPAAVVVIATAAFILPGLLEDADTTPARTVIGPQDDARPRVATPSIGGSTIALPATPRTTDNNRGDADRGTARTATPAGTAITPIPAISVGSTTTGTVAVDNDDPARDDVTVGEESVLGVGAGVGEQLEEAGLPVPTLGQSDSTLLHAGE